MTEQQKSVNKGLVAASVGAVVVSVLLIWASVSKPAVTNVANPARSASQPAGQPPDSPQSNWNVDVKTNPVTDKQTVTLSDRATWLPDGQGLAGSLIVRQTGKSLEVYVATENVLDNGDMTCRFDGKKAISISGSRSTDYEAVFVGNPGVFLKQIEGAKRLVCMVNPYEHTAQPVVFDVGGFPIDQIKIPVSAQPAAGKKVMSPEELLAGSR